MGFHWRKISETKVLQRFVPEESYLWIVLVKETNLP